MKIKDRDQFTYSWDLSKMLKVVTDLQNEVKDFYKWYDESERNMMKHEGAFEANDMRERILKMLEGCCSVDHERGKDVP